MKLLRLIIVSNPDGSNEEVTFTEDKGSPAVDFCCPDQTVNYDGLVEIDLPTQFPVESTLRNVG